MGETIWTITASFRSLSGTVEQLAVSQKELPSARDAMLHAIRMRVREGAPAIHTDVALLADILDAPIGPMNIGAQSPAGISLEITIVKAEFLR